MYTDIMRCGFIIGEVGNPGAITNYMSWVANNAVPEIQCDTASPVWRQVAINSHGLFKFDRADNILILSIWLALPYHYILSRPGAVVWGFGGDGGIVWSNNSINYVIPVADSEVSIGHFLPYRNVTTSPYNALGFDIRDCWVSQIGAAAALNGTRFYPSLFIKVQHTLPLAP